MLFLIGTIFGIFQPEANIPVRINELNMLYNISAIIGCSYFYKTTRNLIKSCCLVDWEIFQHFKDFIWGNCVSWNVAFNCYYKMCAVFGRIQQLFCKVSNNFSWVPIKCFTRNLWTSGSVCIFLNRAYIIVILMFLDMTSSIVIQISQRFPEFDRMCSLY